MFSINKHDQNFYLSWFFAFNSHLHKQLIATKISLLEMLFHVYLFEQVNASWVDPVTLLTGNHYFYTKIESKLPSKGWRCF